jgi:hypothetical protein
MRGRSDASDGGQEGRLPDRAPAAHLYLATPDAPGEPGIPTPVTFGQGSGSQRRPGGLDQACGQGQPGQVGAAPVPGPVANPVQLRADRADADT